jgi:hypothetical protein
VKKKQVLSQNNYESTLCQEKKVLRRVAAIPVLLSVFSVLRIATRGDQVLGPKY